jgi:hypothetical protein
MCQLQPAFPFNESIWTLGATRAAGEFKTARHRGPEIAILKQAGLQSTRTCHPGLRLPWLKST